jgi:fused signal recognition particle receptor
MTVVLLIAVVVVLTAIIAVVAVSFVRSRRSTAVSGSILAPPSTKAHPPAEVISPPESQTAKAPDTAKAPETAEISPPPDVEAPGISDGISEVIAEKADEIPSLEEDRLVVPSRLWRARLARARDALGLALTAVFRNRKIDSEAWDALEEALLGADVGVKMTMELVGRVEREVSKRKVSDSQELVAILKEEILEILDGKDRELHRAENPPSLYLFVGVNGTGKTTSIAKLAQRLREDGASVVIAAADTYRAAATEQLEIWAKRVGAHLVKGSEGADPGAVVFDAVGLARAKGAGYLLVDTAGRLHTNMNLMEELKKIARVAAKAGAPPTETLLVIDATTGQNGLSQASKFGSAVQVTGIVLTKLDGSARGGIVLAIEDELGVPVKLVGIGETAADMVRFDPHHFADALFDERSLRS